MIEKIKKKIDSVKQRKRDAKKSLNEQNLQSKKENDGGRMEMK